jgi:hypothetical protein
MFLIGGGNVLLISSNPLKPLPVRSTLTCFMIIIDIKIQYNSTHKAVINTREVI